MAGGIADPTDSAQEMLPKVLGVFRKSDTQSLGVIPLATFGNLLRRCAAPGTQQALSDENVGTLAEAAGAGDWKGGVAYERLLRWIWVPSAGSGATEAEILRAELSSVAARLPHEATQEALEKRKALWKKWDRNRNRQLSLAELEAGILEDLLNPETGKDLGESRALLRKIKPAVMRAYALAREIYLAGDAKVVEFQEFRPLLGFLGDYLEILKVFDAVDTSHDKRVDLSEFQAALPELQHCLGAGFVVASGEEEKTFQEASKGQRQILFDDFCKWVMQRRLAETQQDQPLALPGDDL